MADEVEFGGRDVGAELGTRFGVGVDEDDIGLEVEEFVSRNSGGGIWQSGRALASHRAWDNLLSRTLGVA